MPILDPANGITDYEAQAEDRSDLTYKPSLADQTLDEARKALFEKQAVTECCKTRRATRLDLYFASLDAAVSRGEAFVINELDLIAKHQQKQRALDETKKSFRTSPIRALEARYQRVTAIPRAIAAFVAFRLAPEIHKAFEEVYGSITPSEGLLPYYVDIKPIIAVLARIKRREKRRAPKQDYEVGYGKTDKRTRFTSINNPSIKSKPVDTLEKLMAGLNKPVAVASAGGKVKMTKLGVGLRRVINDAIRGNKAAIRRVRKLIISLNEKGLLTTPEPLARKKAADPVAFAHTLIIVKVCEVKLVAQIKKELINNYSRRYGPIPDFTTNYERSLPSKVEDIEGWTKLNAFCDAKVAQEERIRQEAETQALESVKAPKTLPYPTRERTRGSGPLQPNTSKSLRRRR